MHFHCLFLNFFFPFPFSSLNFFPTSLESFSSNFVTNINEYIHIFVYIYVCMYILYISCIRENLLSIFYMYNTLWRCRHINIFLVHLRFPFNTYYHINSYTHMYIYTMNFNVYCVQYFEYF